MSKPIEVRVKQLDGRTVKVK